MSVLLLQAEPDVIIIDQLPLRWVILFQMRAIAALSSYLPWRWEVAIAYKFRQDKPELDSKQHKIVPQMQAANIKKGRMLAYEMHLPMLILLLM
jgi:hypothetical protein